MVLFVKILINTIQCSYKPMPRTKKKTTVPQKPYTRVTPRSSHRYASFFAEDETNLTNIYRESKDYACLLGLKKTLKEFIIELAKERNRKITILDSGCGSGSVINELLADKELNNYIDQITGISLHYFNNIEKVMSRHSKRFKYYRGSAQDVLSKAVETSNAFDLILDVWGAYPYSESKLDLLKLYHQALKPYGELRVHLGEGDDLFIKAQATDRYAKPFSLWATCNYPQTFSYERFLTSDLTRLQAVTMKKTTARWLVPRFELFSSKRLPVINSMQDESPSYFEKMEKGNAIKFADIIVVPEKDQPPSLRPLPFKSAS